MGWFRRIVAAASLTVLALTTALVVAAAPPTEKCSASVSGTGLSATARQRDGESADDHDKGYGNDDRCSESDEGASGDDRDDSESSDGNETDGDGDTADDADGADDEANDSDERDHTDGSDPEANDSDERDHTDGSDPEANDSDERDPTDGSDPEANDSDERDHTNGEADDTETDRTATGPPSDGASDDDTADGNSDITDEDAADAASASEDRRSGADGSAAGDTPRDDDGDGQTVGHSGDEATAQPPADGPPASPPVTVEESGSAVLRSVPRSASNAPQPASIGRRVAADTTGPVARVVRDIRVESLGQPLVMSAAPLATVSLDHVVTPLATSDLVARTFMPNNPDVATTLDTILGAARSAARAMAIPAAAAGAVMVFGWAISPAVSGASKSLFVLFR